MLRNCWLNALLGHACKHIVAARQYQQRRQQPSVGATPAAQAASAAAVAAVVGTPGPGGAGMGGDGAGVGGPVEAALRARQAAFSSAPTAVLAAAAAATATADACPGQLAGDLHGGCGGAERSGLLPGNHPTANLVSKCKRPLASAERFDAYIWYRDRITHLITALNAIDRQVARSIRASHTLRSRLYQTWCKSRGAETSRATLVSR